MKTDSAHKSNWAIAEVVFGIPFLISLALHVLIPLPFASGLMRQVLLPVGILLISLGIAIVVSARRELARFAQPTDPGRPTSQIVQTGIFSVSRNPLYLGTVIVLLGIALAFNMLWSLITLLGALVLCHYVLIFPEEKYLAAKFGQAYEAYRMTVWRWLGRSQ